MAIPFLNLTGTSKIKDSDWLQNCFMLSKANINDTAYKTMLLSSANWKFTDTRIGGNVAINNPPAYTRFADPRASGINAKNVSGTKPAGLGEYWSDQIDANGQIIYMQFGVPTFRGILSFFTGASNIEAGLLARTGRVSISFFVGKVVGFVVGLRLLPLILAGTAIKFLMNRSGSKYYNLKPAMHPYWSRVNFIANNLAVAEGLVDRYVQTGEQKFEKYVTNKANYEEGLVAAGTALEPSNTAAIKSLVSAAHAACPELFLADGGVDVYRIVSRYQELANARRTFLETVAAQTNVDGLLTRIIEYGYTNRISAEQKDISSLRAIHEDSNAYGSPNYYDGKDSFADQSNAAAKSALQTALSGATTTADQANAGASPTDQTTQTNSTTPSTTTTTATANKDYVAFDASWYNAEGSDTPARKDGWFKKWWSSLSAQTRAGFDGAFNWVAFRVNSTGSVSASFSNSTSTPEIKSSINDFSNKASKMRFNFSQGQTGIAGIDTIVSGIKDAVVGFGAGIELLGLVSLAGTSFIDIPDTWEDSTGNLPSESYEMHLRTPYGNVLSRYMNLHIPLSMLLAGALPISTGRQTYASPFICKIISPGKSNMDLAIIDSLSVTHGVGNLGFTRNKKPLQIDISMQPKDLNRICHIPIDTGGAILNPLNAMSIFDDDNAFNYYLNTLAGLSVADQVLATRRLDRRVREKMMAYSSFFSTSHLTLALTESDPGRALRSVAAAAGTVFPSIAPGMNKIQ